MARGCIGFLIGAVAGYGLGILGYILWSYVHFDRDGAIAMGVAFFIAPLLALAGGLIGLFAARRRA